MKLHLGTKLLAINIGPLLVTSLIWTLYVPTLQARMLQKGLETKVESLGNLLVRTTGPDLALSDAKAAAEGLANVGDDVDFQFALLLKEDETVFASVGETSAYRRFAADLPSRGLSQHGPLTVGVFPVVMQG
jgi:hypothetical protein